MSTQIHDPIHDFITITPLMERIIDTPEFQRLRELKQLGATYFVFPSATHSRFSHSLGVSHLAGELMETLQKNQARLGISGRDIELTRIAALVHDIGHGPFSHLYDEHVKPSTQSDHEIRGCDVFREMVIKYELPLTQWELEKVILMINPTNEVKNKWSYQIVANKLCQIDVDKLDYIRRDSYHLGIKINDSFSRLITSARVVETPGGDEVLAWPKKLEFSIFNLFAARYQLHRQVYNHHSVKAHEFVIVEILNNIKQSLKNETWRLTDASVMCPLHSQFSTLYQKIHTRKTVKLVGELVVKLPHKAYRPEDPNPRTIVDHIIQVTKIGFATGNDNPLGQVYYYAKDDINVGFRCNPQNSSFCIPASHQELIVRMFSYPGEMDDNKSTWELYKQQWDEI
jgi:HD superfamily phosphohydrolase